MKIHTLIVGAGPAGAACAIRLQQLGVECMLVEKMTLPRQKLCAGLFTHKSQQCLKVLLGNEKYEACMADCVMSHEDTVTLYKGTEQLVSFQPQEPVTLIDRPKFDAWLVNYFVSLGGQFLEGETLIGLDYYRKAALFHDREIEYSYLIAADGSNSTVEKFLSTQFPTSFKSKGKCPLCVEINVERDDLDITGVNVYLGVVPNSYAWVFSKGDKVCVGTVKLENTNFNVNERFTQFLHDIGLKHIEKYPIHGAMLPIGKYIKNPYYGNIMLVGDAAGLVEPLTGEGIFYALQSGVFAAESVKDEDAPSLAYNTKVRFLQKLIDKGGYYQGLLEKKWALNYFFRNAGKHPGFIKYFYDSQIEHASLRSFIQIILKYKLG